MPALVVIAVVLPVVILIARRVSVVLLLLPTALMGQTRDGPLSIHRRLEADTTADAYPRSGQRAGSARAISAHGAFWGGIDHPALSWPLLAHQLSRRSHDRGIAQYGTQQASLTRPTESVLRDKTAPHPDAAAPVTSRWPSGAGSISRPDANRRAVRGSAD